MNSKFASFIFIISLIFLADVFLIHFIKSDLEWSMVTLSHYALGDFGYIINVGFYCFATAEIACAALLILNSPRSIVYSALFFTLAGIGALLVAVFPVQPPTADIATRLPHILGAIMQFMFFPLALFAIDSYLVDSHMKSYTRLTGYVTFIFFVILLSLFIVKSKYQFPYFGLLEKIDIVLITIWLIIFSYLSIRSNIFKAR